MTVPKLKSHSKLKLHSTSTASTDSHANPIFSSDVPSGSAISFKFPWFETCFIFVLVGKLRLAKWFIPLSSKAKAKVVQDLTQLTISRRQQSCNFIEYKGTLNIKYQVSMMIRSNLNDSEFPGEKVCLFT